MQTIAVAPGTYSMTLKATDASSTMATTTCSSTVATTTPTGSDISAQIQTLLDQIAKLKAQVLLLIMQHSGSTGTVATSTSGTCFDFHRDLHDGDNGDDVKQLQLTLSSDPSIFPRGLITGFFGHRTQEAVRKFEEKFDIASTSSGFFGPQMRENLREQCGSQDNDHDGSSNTSDTDDDNDGIPDVQDPTPLIPDSQIMSTSTSFMNGNHENQVWHGENGRGRGNGQDSGSGERDSRE